MVRENKCGFVYPSGNGDILATRIIGLLSDQELLNSMRSNAMTLHRRKFDSAVIYPSIASHLIKVAKEAPLYSLTN